MNNDRYTNHPNTHQSIQNKSFHLRSIDNLHVRHIDYLHNPHHQNTLIDSYSTEHVAY